MNVIMSILPWLSGILGGGAIVGVLVKTFHWPRPWERMVISGPKGLIKDKDGNVREYTGFTPRLAGFYRTATVNIRDHMDNILLDGVMRPTEDGHRERWHLAATVKWHVEEGEGRVYRACEWQITDLGEFARGKIQDALLNHLENTVITGDLNSAGIFEACVSTASEELLEHGVVWTDLMINTHAMADSEIQGQAIRRIAKSIDNVIPRRPAA